MRKFLVAVPLLVLCYSISIAMPQKVLLKNGELWAEGAALTNTGGKVDGFEISPSGQYVAAHKIIDYIEEHDDSLEEGQKPNMIPAYSVLIIDLKNRKVLNEIKAPEELLHLGMWGKGDIYRFTTGSQLDIIGTYDYDAKSNKVRKLDFITTPESINSDPTRR